MFRKRSALAAALAALILLPVWAGAHSGAMGVVKERMEHMKVLGASMKALSKIVGGKTPYDAAEVATLAERFALGGGVAMIKLFPEGTNAHPSEARPEIWQQWDRFQDMANQLQTQGEAMRTTVHSAGQNGSSDALRQDFMALAAVCKSCHTAFRQEKSD